MHVGGVSLEMVMKFFSASEVIPLQGYSQRPVINFNPISLYPTTSTCAFILTLPTRHSSYQPFKDAMDIGFTMHGGFGLS